MFIRVFIIYLKKMFKKRAVKQERIIDINNAKSTQEQSVTNTDNHQHINKQNRQQQQQQQQVIQHSQPQKRIKLDLPSNIISSSTSENKQKKQAQLHKEFKSLNYQAGEQLSNNDDKKHSTQQLLLEEQLAKRKYMENVNITKDIKQGKLDTKVYRGINNYANYALTEDEIVNAQQKFRKRQGPSRVNSTIRNTSRFDYNFGLCKDWHDSGYCPFGDSCIYLHDRSNYKTGWEQERDFEKAEKERWRRISNPQLAAKQDIQQALKTIQKYKVNDICEKCKKQFRGPVQVECGHIFCTGCAATMSKCVICKKSLSGIMNNAEKKMHKMKQTYQQMKSKILKQHQQSKMKRKKYTDLESQDVFAD